MKNIIRIMLGSLLALAILFGIVWLLPSTPLVWCAGLWCAGAVIVFASALAFWLNGKKINYVLNAAFVLNLWGLVASQFVLALVFVCCELLSLFTISVGWYCLIAFILLALFSWRLLAMGIGKDAILAIENSEERSKYKNWKMVAADLNIINQEAAASENAGMVSRIYETFLFSDPVTPDSLKDLDEKIFAEISALREAVKAHGNESVNEICHNVEEMLQLRAEKIKILK